MLQVYDDQGVRFEYPRAWELEVTEDGTRVTIAVNAPSGLAFAFITLETAGEVDVNDLANEALAALREEYPSLRAHPSNEVIDDHEALGHDIEFVSLDMINGATIRCWSSPRRAVLFFSQWTEVGDDEDYESDLIEVRRSFEETDS